MSMSNEAGSLRNSEHVVVNIDEEELKQPSPSLLDKTSRQKPKISKSNVQNGDGDAGDIASSRRPPAVQPLKSARSPAVTMGNVYIYKLTLLT